MDIQQRRDDLQVVFDAVMHFTDELALSLECARHVALGVVDAGDGSTECIAQLLDLGRGAELSRQVERASRMIVRHGALKSLQWADQDSADDDPSHERGRDPHQHGQQQQEPVDRGDPPVGDADARE